MITPPAHRVRLGHLLLALAAPAGSLATQSIAPNINGQWETPFVHDDDLPNNFPCQGRPVTVQNQAEFNAIHLVAIPPRNPSLAGYILALDEPLPSGTGLAMQRYAIFDPITKTFTRNRCLTLPGSNTVNLTTPVSGDFFCSGHCATQDGLLVFAGGTIWHTTAPNSSFDGSKLVYTWDPMQEASPTDGGWTRQPDLATPRYYPTATAINDDKIAVTGGMDFGSNYPLFSSTYEVFTPPAAYGGLGAWDQNQSGGPNSGQRIYYGPQRPTSPNPTPFFYWYPRMFLMSDGAMFMAGIACDGARAVHNRDTTLPNNDPGWDYLPGQFYFSGTRTYDQYLAHGSPVLNPIRLNLSNPGTDTITRYGGAGTTPPSLESGVPVDWVQTCNVQPGVASSWSYGTPLVKKRMYCNAVRLPDESVFVVGGWDGTAAVESGELVRGSLRILVPNNNGDGTRLYHSTAILLRDGSVLVAGGDAGVGNAPRSWDYQIYKPPYFFQGARPTINSPTGVIQMSVSAPTPISLFCTYQNSEGDLAPIEKVVLMRLGSVTHHFDQDQRHIELRQAPIAPPAPIGRVDVYPPSSKNIAPLGYYMLFAVAEGKPSVASWVQVVP